MTTGPGSAVASLVASAPEMMLPDEPSTLQVSSRPGSDVVSRHPGIYPPRANRGGVGRIAGLRADALPCLLFRELSEDDGKGRDPRSEQWHEGA
jgi:hypothetical protein